MDLTWVLLAGVGASVLLWLSCEQLETASHRLATYYGIPDIVKGSVLTAIASSFPEFATAVLALPVHGDFELGLAAIIGSAIYNILVIPAASTFAIGGALKSNPAIVYREAQFYLVSVVAVLLVVCLTVIYGPNGSPAYATGQVITGSFSWPLALLLISLYGLYLFIQYEEVKDHRRRRTQEERVESQAGISVVREWARMLTTMAAIVAGVEVLLRVAMWLGDALGTPTFLWGLTVVAAATSIPDTFISVRAARLGRSASSISNALGSNIFDLLVALPIGVLLVGSIGVNFTQTVPMMGFLTIATIVTLVFLRRDMKLSLREATVMMAMYLAFGGWMALEAFGVTHLLGLAATG